MDPSEKNGLPLYRDPPSVGIRLWVREYYRKTFVLAAWWNSVEVGLWKYWKFSNKEFPWTVGRKKIGFVVPF